MLSQACGVSKPGGGGEWPLLRWRSWGSRGGAVDLMLPCCHGLSPQASICRSSQPLSGFSARCLEDEQMLQAIRKANPGSDFIYVVDTRPKVSVATPIHVFAAQTHGGEMRLRLQGAVSLCTAAALPACFSGPRAFPAPSLVLGTWCTRQKCGVTLEIALLNMPGYSLVCSQKDLFFSNNMKFTVESLQFSVCGMVTSSLTNSACS